MLIYIILATTTLLLVTMLVFCLQIKKVYKRYYRNQAKQIIDTYTNIVKYQLNNLPDDIKTTNINCLQALVKHL